MSPISFCHASLLFFRGDIRPVISPPPFHNILPKTLINAIRCYFGSSTAAASSVCRRSRTEKFQATIAVICKRMQLGKAPVHARSCGCGSTRSSSLFNHETLPNLTLQTLFLAAKLSAVPAIVPAFVPKGGMCVQLWDKHTLSCSCSLCFTENGHRVPCPRISLSGTTEAGPMPRGTAEPHPVHRSAYVATETFSDPFTGTAFTTSLGTHPG